MGMPSVRTIWQPMLRMGQALARATPSSKAGPSAMSVAEVMEPALWSSAMARLMPGVSPKSSALMMRREGMATKWNGEYAQSVTKRILSWTHGPVLFLMSLTSAI